MTPEPIRITGVTHRYRKVTALDSISLEISPGRLVGLIGPDGVGKSTLLSLVASARLLQQGKVSCLGGDMANAGPSSWRLSGELTVRQNLDLHARHFALPAATRRRRIGESTGRFGRSRAISTSGPAPCPFRVRQRVSLAVAVQDEPQVLILDEPTSGVDPEARDALWEILVELVRDPVRLAFAFFGSAILMVVFCYGISLDVRDQRFAALDLDQTPESRAYIAAYERSHYFAAVAEPRSAPEADRLLAEGAASVTIGVPPGFGRALPSGGRPEVLVVVDGAPPFRGETLEATPPAST